MRARLAALGVAAVAGLTTFALATPAYADTLTDAVNGLTVAAENHAGYDRDLFGVHDRDAELAANFADWPACDGYYSEADNLCYTDPGEVDVDHIVALGEAWDSGAFGWTADQRDAYGEDSDNLWLMTDNLNASKGDDDIAEWTPPNPDAACGYVATYVAIKVKWKLSVDQAEKAALVDLAADCAEPGTEPSEEPTGEPTSEPTTAPSSSAPPAAGGDLPITGASLTGVAVGGTLLVGAGAALVLWRRRVRFTA